VEVGAQLTYLANLHTELEVSNDKIAVPSIQYVGRGREWREPRKGNGYPLTLIIHKEMARRKIESRSWEYCENVATAGMSWSSRVQISKPVDCSGKRFCSIN